MTTPIIFDYSLGQKVELIEIQRPATVIGLIVDNLGKQYQCVYWDESQRHTAWLFGSEIKDSCTSGETRDSK